MLPSRSVGPEPEIRRAIGTGAEPGGTRREPCSVPPETLRLVRSFFSTSADVVPATSELTAAKRLTIATIAPYATAPVPRICWSGAV